MKNEKLELKLDDQIAYIKKMEDKEKEIQSLKAQLDIKDEAAVAQKRKILA